MEQKLDELRWSLVPVFVELVSELVHEVSLYRLILKLQNSLNLRAIVHWHATQSNTTSCTLESV